MPQIIPRYLCHFPSLMTIHRCLRRLYIMRRPRLNFHKTKNISIPSNQIDFSSKLRATKISCYDNISKASQVEVSVLFPTRSSPLMPRPFIRGQYASGEPIEGSNDDPSESGWKHHIHGSE